MKKHKEGHVYIYDLEADPSKLDALNRELRLEDDLLQLMVTHPLPAAKQPGSKREVAASGR